MIKPMLISGFTIMAVAGSASGQTSDADIQAICTAVTSLSNQICECVMDFAAEEFSAAGQSYVAAIMQGDQAAMTAVQPTVPTEERLTVPFFLINAPGHCDGVP